MCGILAVLAFALAFLFHGFAFKGNVWVDPPSMMYLGLVFLALHLLGVGAGLCAVAAGRVSHPLAPQQQPRVAAPPIVKTMIHLLRVYLRSGCPAAVGVPWLPGGA